MGSPESALPRAMFFPKMLFQSIEFFRPELLEELHPIQDFLERPWVKLVNPLPTDPLFRNQADVLEHRQLLRNGGERDAKRLSELARRLLSLHQLLEDLASHRVRDRLKDILAAKCSGHGSNLLSIYLNVKEEKTRLRFRGVVNNDAGFTFLPA